MLFYLPKVAPVSGGSSYASCKLYFYATGTSSDATVYTDSALTTPHAQPVQADSGGVFAPIYVSQTTAYRVVLKTSAGSTVWDVDPFPALLDSAASIGAVLWARTAAEISASVTPSSYAYEPGDVRRYGAVGNGSTDDSTALQNALTCNRDVTIPHSFNCKITTGLTFPASTRLRGGKITSTIDGAAALTLVSGCTVESLILVGPASAAYDDDEDGIYFAGASAASYVEAITIKDCWIYNFGNAAIWGEWCQQVRIDRCRLTNCGYAGAMILSGTDCHVTNSYISDITPGTSSNVYGIAFSRWGLSDSLVTYPRCTDCSAVGNTVRDIAVWEGIDSHSGERILIADNAFYNVKFAINVGPTTSHDAPTESVHAPLYCVISGNTVENQDADGYGIAVTGASTTVVGSPNEYAQGCSIHGNTILQCGYANNSIAGAIYVHTAKGIAITGNLVREPKSNGIMLGYDVLAMSVTGNVIVDPHDATLNTCACVALDGGNFSGVISGNAFLKVNAALDTYVSEYACYWATEGTSALRIGGNYSNCDTEWYNEAFSEHVGSYTGTLTGVSGTVTGTIEYTLTDRMVVLEIPTITGTASGTACTITGMPALIRPGTAQVVKALTHNNGAEVFGKISIGTNGTMTLYNGLSATFSNTSTQGVSNCTVTYRLT